MDDTTIKLIFTNLGWLIAKIEELPGRDIGEPDCMLIDPCTWMHGTLDHGHSHDDDSDHDHSQDPLFTVIRFPGKDASLDTRIAISSSNIFTIMDPTPALVSEYLVTISD